MVVQIPPPPPPLQHRHHHHHLGHLRHSIAIVQPPLIIITIPTRHPPPLPIIQPIQPHHDYVTAMEHWYKLSLEAWVNSKRIELRRY